MAVVEGTYDLTAVSRLEHNSNQWKVMIWGQIKCSHDHIKLLRVWSKGPYNPAFPTFGDRFLEQIHDGDRLAKRSVHRVEQHRAQIYHLTAWVTDMEV